MMKNTTAPEEHPPDTLLKKTARGLGNLTRVAMKKSGRLAYRMLTPKRLRNKLETIRLKHPKLMEHLSSVTGWVRQRVGKLLGLKSKQVRDENREDNTRATPEKTTGEPHEQAVTLELMHGKVNRTYQSFSPEKLIEAFNDYRQKKDPTLPSFEYDPQLNAMAEEEITVDATRGQEVRHSPEIVSGDLGKKVGEIKTAGFQNLHEALENLLNSPLHRQYILSNRKGNADRPLKIGFGLKENNEGTKYLCFHISPGAGQTLALPPVKQDEKKQASLTDLERDIINRTTEEESRYWEEQNQTGTGELPPDISGQLERINRGTNKDYRLPHLIAAFCQEWKQANNEHTLSVAEELGKHDPEQEKAFWITLSNGNKRVSYRIQKGWTMLTRLKKGSKQHEFVAFDQVLEDFKRAPDTGEIMTELRR